MKLEYVELADQTWMKQATGALEVEAKPVCVVRVTVTHQEAMAHSAPERLVVDAIKMLQDGLRVRADLETERAPGVYTSGKWDGFKERPGEAALAIEAPLWAVRPVFVYERDARDYYANMLLSNRAPGWR